MEKEPTTEELEEQQLRADQLAACYSLLDSFRRGSRQDVLVGALVAVLARRGGLTVQRLFEAVKRMWRTDAIADPVLEQALENARAGGLITSQTDLDGNETFVVSVAAKAESETDRAYIAHLLRQFTDEVADRLQEYPDASRLVKRAERIANLVVTAIAHACDGFYGIDTLGVDPWARPDHISVQKVRAFAANQQPRSVRDPTAQLALDALDPSDSFGNQVVHLVVVSNLLHGLAAQRGVGASPALSRMQVLLDTSVLVGLAMPEDDSAHRLVVQLAKLSSDCGATVVVAQHTLDEWERVWEAADQQEVSQRLRANKGLAPRVARLVNNPFLSAYLTYRHNGGTDSWSRWQMSRRDIRRRLEALGVNIQTYEPSTALDLERSQAIFDRLVELSNDPATPATRTEAAASADALSAAMVTQWRDDAGIGGALMLAHDRLTNQAYSEIIDAEAPIVGDPGAWLLYVSNLTADDAVELVHTAEFVADLAVRNTILEIASSYSLEEALDISEILVQGQNGLTAREARDLADPSLFDVLDAIQKESAEDARTRAAAVLQRRATRSNRRAAFREEIQSSELASVKDEADKQVGLVREEAKQYESEAARERKRADKAEISSGKLEVRNLRLQRALIVLSVFSLAAILLVFLVTLGLLGGVGSAIGFVGLAIVGLYGWFWIDRPDTPTTHVVTIGALHIALSIFWWLVL